MAYGAHVPIAAAEERKQKLQRDEEEDMTGYTRQDLENDWEFKIVRSASGAFKRPEVLQELLQEEALAGWEMVEKFDDNRVRFKRSSSSRRRDAMLPENIDPYRTQYGGLGNQKAILLAFAIGLSMLVALGTYFLVATLAIK